MITPRIPYPPNDGGAIRMFNIFKNLAENYELDLLSFDEGNHLDNLEQLEKFCRNVYRVETKTSGMKDALLVLKSIFTSEPFMYLRYESGEMRSFLKKLRHKNKYDFVFFNNIHTGQYYTSCSGLRKVVDLHNNDSVIMKRWADRQTNPVKKKLGKIQAEYVADYLKKSLPEMNVVITVSEKEKEQMQNFAPDTRFIVADNGVDIDFYQPQKNENKEPNLLYTGDMAWWPNTDASLFFLDEIFPEIQNREPEARVILAGRRPPEQLASRAGKYIEITGFVEDMRTYFNRAKAFIVPLRVGGGTRLKILEAMAMKIPIVSTSVGCEGLEVENEKHLLIRDDPKEFAQAVLRLLSDEDLRNRLVKNAYELVAQKYDWKIIMEDMVKKLEGEMK